MSSNIRLSQEEKENILSAIRAHDPDANIYLYGSRAEPLKMGGDIDLLVVSEVLNFSDKLEILIELKSKLGDQKIDLSLRSKKALAADAFFSSPAVQKSLVAIG